MVELRTERLLLRPAREEDLASFYGILSDPRAMAYWSTPPHDDISQTNAWLTAMVEIDPKEGEDFVVELDGIVIGKAGLFRFPEIGFIFHPDAWGRGFAQEALRAVLDRAFACHGLSAIEADVDPRNGAALRLLMRLGFSKVGHARQTWLLSDQWCDSVYLRLGVSEWTG